MLNQLRQMAIFVRTIDHGSFRAAARALKLSPSVVSHQISQLEQALGTALIYRSTRDLSLTSDGERLLTSARIMLEAAEDGLQSVSDQTPEPSGELRITMPAVMAHSQLVAQLAEFSTASPNVELSVDFSDTRKSLIGDGFDLAIRMGWLKDSALIARKLSSVKRHLVASTRYFDARPKPSSPKDLGDWDWLELAPVGTRNTVFRKSGHKAITLKPASRISVNDAHALYQFARSGAGLALVPDFLAEEDEKAGIVGYVLPDWRVEDIGVFAVWPHNAPKGGLTRYLIDRLTLAAAQTGQ